MDNYEKWWMNFDMNNTGSLFENLSSYFFDKYNVYPNIEAFIDYYSNSELRKQIDMHHPRFSVLSGKEIIELIINYDFDKMIPDEFISTSRVDEYCDYKKNELYWIGWFITYCKYKKNTSFSYIYNYIGFSELRRLYITYHEMDNSVCYNKIFANEYSTTRTVPVV